MKRLKRPHNQNAPELSIELIRNILSWLPADSLLIFKRVCKLWRSLIEDSDFIKQYATRASLVFVWDCYLHIHKNFTTLAGHPAYNFPGLQRGFSVLGIFEGYYKLLCRNPVTCKGLELPQPYSHLHPSKFLYFDSSTNVAKLIFVYSVLNCADSVSETGFQTLQIEQGRNWRIFRTLRENERVMISEDNGTMYFISYHFDNRKNIFLHITTFDVRTESLDDHNFILGKFWPDYANVYFFWWNNCLALGYVTSEKSLLLKVLEKNDNKYKWSRMMFEVPLAFLSRNVHCLSIHELAPGKAINNDLWLSYKGVEGICYDVKTREIKEKRNLPLDKSVTTFKYGPSLKFLQGMKTIKIVEVEDPILPMYYINF